MLTDQQIQHFLMLAYHQAAKSPDPSTQNGAVIVREYGGGADMVCGDFNRFPVGFANDARWNDRELKYPRVVHAERAVIYHALQSNLSLTGLSLVCPWSTCAQCALAIVESGIRWVYAHKAACSRGQARWWQDEITIALDILKEGRVQYVEYDGLIPGAPRVRHSRRLWSPAEDGVETDPALDGATKE